MQKANIEFKELTNDNVDNVSFDVCRGGRGKGKSIERLRRREGDMNEKDALWIVRAILHAAAIPCTSLPRIERSSKMHVIPIIITIYKEVAYPYKSLTNTEC